MDKYEVVRDIGSGNFGVARLMRNKATKELVAMKYIERGRKVCISIFAERTCISSSPSFVYDSVPIILYKIDENVAREIINHRSLRHPNIIRFKEVDESNISLVCNFVFRNSNCLFFASAYDESRTLITGCSDADSSSDCDGICHWRRAVRAHLQRW